MMTDKLFLRALADMVSVHATYGKRDISEEALMSRAWRLLRSAPTHPVALHPRGFYALGASMASWTGYDDAYFFLEDLFAHEFTMRPPNCERQAFAAFWAELDHWPLIPLAAEFGIQYRNQVRCDEMMEPDGREAYRLHLAGTEDDVLLSALQEPGLLAERGHEIEGVPAEYATALLGMLP